MTEHGSGPAPSLDSPGIMRREPVFNVPLVIVVLVAILVTVHLVRQLLDPEQDLAVLAQFAVVPARFALDLGWFDWQQLAEQVVRGASAADAGQRFALARYFVDGDGPRWWSVLSYGLLHGGTAHIVMNGLWLAIFGSPLARRLGAARFVLLVILGTICGAASHIWLHAFDVLPLVGASAGVSAATGAAARFVFSRGLRLDQMATDAAVRNLPALSLAGMVSNRQTLAFVLLWFASNWLFGAGVVGFAGEDHAIAWEAHIGGFFAGLLLFPWLDRNASVLPEQQG